MLALALAVLTVTLSPATQTISLGQTARVTATITHDYPKVDLSWGPNGQLTAGTYKGRTISLQPKAIGPSSIQLPLPATVQLSSTTQQVTEWTFTKQGTYNFVLTARAPDGKVFPAYLTINVKRR